MILIFEQDLTHYRASFYDFLSEYSGKKVIVVTGDGEPGAYHIIEGMHDRRFKVIQIKRRWFKNKFYVQYLGEAVRALVSAGEVECVVHRGAIRNLSLVKEIMFFKKHNVPVVLRGIGFSNNREFSPKSNIFDFYHAKIVGMCDAYLCYTVGSKKVLDQFYNPDKVFVAVNTLNSRLLRDHYRVLSISGRESIKSELGLDKHRYLIHVGRFSRRKKIDRVVKIYLALKAKEPNLGLILVGDGPERQSVESLVKDSGIKDVVFTGAISSEDMLVSKYLFCSDLFVITGNIGLSINHSLLFGVPVVAHVLPKGSRRPKGYVQTPEYEYLVDGYNGISVSVDTVNSYVEASSIVLNDNSYKGNAYNYASEVLTVEAMAEGYVKSIDYAKRKIKRTRV